MSEEKDVVEVFAVGGGRKTLEVAKNSKSPKSKTYVKELNTSYVNPVWNFEYLKALFEFNSTHKFCIRLKTTLTCGLGIKYKKNVPKAIVRFMKSPNNLPAETWTKFCKKLKFDSEIYGRYCIEIAKVGDKVSFFHVPANEVFVVQKGNTQEVEKYIQKSNSGTIVEFLPYNPDKVADGGRFMYVSDTYSPSSRFYGVPDYVSSIKAIIGNDTISSYMLNFFANNARPDFFLTVTGQALTEKQRTELESKLSTTKGIENAHKAVLLVLGNDSARVEIKEISKVVDDNFRNTKLDNRDEIAQIHGVPPKVLGISSAGSLGSGNEAIGALKILIECVVNPAQIEFEEELNALLGNVFKYDKDIFSFETINLVNEKDLAIINKTYLECGVLSINEIREGLVLSPLGKEYDAHIRQENISENMDIRNDDMANIDPDKDNTQRNA